MKGSSKQKHGRPGIDWLYLKEVSLKIEDLDVLVESLGNGVDRDVGAFDRFFASLPLARAFFGTKAAAAESEDQKQEQSEAHLSSTRLASYIG